MAKGMKLLLLVVILCALYASPAWAQFEQINKTAPNTVIAGQDFSYTITVSNTGPAATAQVVDSLPTGVDLNGPLPSICSSNEVADQITVTCNLSIGADTTGTITLNVEAPETNPPPAAWTITNTVQTPGLAPVNVTTTVVPGADLEITKDDNPNPVDVGDNLAYTLTVTNNGPNTAVDVELVDDLPGNVIFISGDEGENECVLEPGQVVECELGNLNPGESTEVQVFVEPEDEGTVTNTAQVDSDTVDPDPDNNEDSVTTTVEDDDNGGNGNNNDGDDGDNDFFDDDFDDNFFDEFFDDDLDDEEDILDDEEDLLDDDEDTEDGVSADADDDGATANTPGTSATAGDPDEQAPVSRPRGDVVDEIDTGGIPLPPTGGRPVATLAPVAGIALVPLIALVATGLSARWVRRRRRER